MEQSIAANGSHYAMGRISAGYSVEGAVRECVAGIRYFHWLKGVERDFDARFQRLQTELFALCRNQLYGEFVQDLENIEGVAGALASTFFQDRTPADEIEALMSLTHRDADEALRDWLREENSATMVIRPAGGD